MNYDIQTIDANLSTYIYKLKKDNSWCEIQLKYGKNGTCIAVLK